MLADAQMGRLRKPNAIDRSHNLDDSPDCAGVLYVSCWTVKEERMAIQVEVKLICDWCGTAFPYTTGAERDATFSLIVAAAFVAATRQGWESLLGEPDDCTKYRCPKCSVKAGQTCLSIGSIE